MKVSKFSTGNVDNNHPPRSNGFTKDYAAFYGFSSGELNVKVVD